MAKGLITVRPRPCPTCPYRRDVPSGVWAAIEYEKLPLYDGDTGEQAEAMAFSLFHCHSSPRRLCAGWVGCHDMDENLAMRLHHRTVDPAVYDYQCPVPLFGSGAEAAAHGMRDLEDPSPEAQAAAKKLTWVVVGRTDG
jgi:hypothetical protein